MKSLTARHFPSWRVEVSVLPASAVRWIRWRSFEHGGCHGRWHGSFGQVLGVNRQAGRVNVTRVAEAKPVPRIVIPSSGRKRHSVKSLILHVVLWLQRPTIISNPSADPQRGIGSNSFRAPQRDCCEIVRNSERVQYHCAGTAMWRLAHACCICLHCLFSDLCAV